MADPGRTPRSRPARTATLGLTVVLGVAAGSPVQGQGVPFDTASLAHGPSARACMLMERTIFQVDVLTLDLRFGPETAERLQRQLERGAPRDSLARTAMESRNVFARLEFLRDLGMDRFLDGVRADLRTTVRAGLIDQETFEEVSTGLPRWYGFLEERGVREGDQVLYRIRGDTLVSGYRSAQGEMLLQQTDVGPERRLSVLGSYLGEGSSFRERLLDSLMDRDGGC